MKKPHPKSKKRARKRGSLKSFPSRKQKKRYYWLKVLPDDLWLKVRRNKTIWEALQKTDIELEGDCGGQGQCGKCKILVTSSIGPPSDKTKELIDEEERKRGIRLACRTKIRKDLTIYTEESDSKVDYYQILKTGERPILHIDPLISKRPVILPATPNGNGISDLDRIKLALGPDFRGMNASLDCLRKLPTMLQRTRNMGSAVFHEKCLLAWQSWDKVNNHFGLVFDLGTSTLVGKLINLQNGSERAAISRLNTQIRYGTSVISRLQYIEAHARGLFHLHDLLIKDLNRIAKRLLEVEKLHPDELFVAVAAGNTTMQHLMLAIDPLGIAGAPFAPVLTDGLVLKADEIGLKLHPEARLYVMPIKAGYIGGDLLSTILASGAAEQNDKIILGLDLGTNGEIFLGNRKRLMTCSAAAGPALEGANISSGMIAKSGAIEGVRSGKDQLNYQMIGNIKPKGICGSGLVDLAAVLLHCGVIDNEGMILPPWKRAEDNQGFRVVERSGVYDFLVVSPAETSDGSCIYLTQKDIRELQLCKGAIAAGIQILMDSMGIDFKDLDQIYMAGALGNYIHPHSAIRIGLLPKVNPDIIKSLGNAASTGASMVLLSKSYWQMALTLAHTIEHIELSDHPNFTQYFIQNLDFPNENIL
jgi:uncharacterized 2Fe-2S/4Fe-4S cluster protein (DUF4445 family)